MLLAFYQFSPRFAEIEANLQTVLSALANAEADLIVLPELPFTGYLFRDRAELAQLAEKPQRSTTIQLLIELCRRRNFHLVTGFAEKAGDKIYNSALLLNGQGIVSTYRKLHLFNREKLYFDPGDLPLRVDDVGEAKLGMMICFDWVYPEVCRTLALLGAEVVCHPSNLVLDYCPPAMITRCQENAVFAVTVNRCGEEVRDFASLKFIGNSQLVAPKGELLTRAAPDETCLTTIEIDPSRARNKFMTERNDLLADRRPEWYHL